MKYIIIALLITPVTVYSQWTSTENVDEMEGTTTYFAISPDVKPTRQMTFPYGDITSNLVIACKEANTFAYFYFSDSPNLTEDETEDGYNLVRTRLKVDEVIENISLTQTWGANSLFLLNEEIYIQKAKEASEFLLELNWYGNGKVYFRYDLSGSAKKINEAENNCGIPQRLEANLRKEQEKKRIAEESIPEFNKAVDEYFMTNPTTPKLLEMTSGYSGGTALSGYLSLSYSCGQVRGFSYYLEIEMSNLDNIIKAYNPMGMCYEDKASMTLDNDDIDFDYLLSVYDNRNKLDEMVKSVKLRLTGRVSPRLRYLKPEGATTFSKDYSYTLYESVED